MQRTLSVQMPDDVVTLKFVEMHEQRTNIPAAIGDHESLGLLVLRFKNQLNVSSLSLTGCRDEEICFRCVSAQALQQTFEQIRIMEVSVDQNPRLVARRQDWLMRLNHIVFPGSVRHACAEVMCKWIFPGGFVITFALCRVGKWMEAESRATLRSTGMLLAPRHRIL